MSQSPDSKNITTLTDELIMSDEFPSLFTTYFTECLQSSLADATAAGHTLYGILDGEIVEVPASFELDDETDEDDII